MKIEFSINSIIRGGKNNMMVSRSGHHYPNKKWAEWRDMIVDHLRTMKVITNPLDQDCRLTVSYWNGDKRRRDIPAMVDSLYHIFERAGIITDDSLIKELHWNPCGYDKLNPRVSIILETI